MFDLNKLGDMTKIADQARQVNARQEKAQREQAELLRRISAQLERITVLLEKTMDR